MAQKEAVAEAAVVTADPGEGTDVVNPLLNALDPGRGDAKPGTMPEKQKREFVASNRTDETATSAGSGKESLAWLWIVLAIVVVISLVCLIAHFLIWRKKHSLVLIPAPTRPVATTPDPEVGLFHNER